MMTHDGTMYKIVCGANAHQGFWQGEVFPNSSRTDTDPGCPYPSCCLFDIIGDETGWLRV
jgi:hypothetical protein